MDATVFLAVLFAAACHAGWNAVVKIGLDAFSTTSLIAVGAGVVAIVLLPFFPIPPAAAWPWLIASMILHLAYYIALIEAYRAGDMGQVYPIARGTAPLMTGTLSPFLVGESLDLLTWIGILGLAFGVLLISFRGGQDIARFERRAVGFALVTAVTITGYSFVDGIGARISGNAVAYTLWLFALDGVMMLMVALYWRGTAFVPHLKRYWKSGVFGGGLSMASYGIAIWAMTVAPIALVAALRETSVLFGSIIAVIFLKEKLRANRVVAAVMIVGGMMLIRLH